MIAARRRRRPAFWAAGAALAAAVWCAAGPGGLRSAGAAAPSLAYPLHITADSVTVDNTGKALVARGHVGLTYGADRATADTLRLDRAARTATLRGHVAVTGPEGQASGETVTLYFTPDDQVARVVMTGNAGVQTKRYALSADSIDADHAADRLVASGHASAFMAPDLIVNGDRVIYNQRARYGVVTGHPVVQNKAGRVRGGWIELFRAQNRAVVHGPVEAEVYGATITGERAAVDFARAAAVVTGHVVIVRRQGTVSADRVTILYGTRRIIAQGKTHATFTDLGDASNP